MATINLKPDFLTKLESNKLNEAPFMMLGDVTFKLGSLPISKLSQSQEFHYSRFETIKGMAKTQYLGEGPIIIELNGTIVSQFTSEEDEGIRTLTDAARSGKELSLFDSDGKVHGKWVILSINHEVSQMLIGQSGTKTIVHPQTLNFSMRLQRVDE